MFLASDSNSFLPRQGPQWLPLCDARRSIRDKVSLREWLAMLQCQYWALREPLARVSPWYVLNTFLNTVMVSRKADLTLVLQETSRSFRKYHGIAETLTRVPGHKQACCYKQSLPCLPRKPLEPEFFFLVIRTQSPHRLRCTRDASRVFTVWHSAIFRIKGGCVVTTADW